MASKRHIPLSDNHRRSVTTMLTLLDERLCEFEEIARGREVRSLLYRECNDLSAQQRERLLQDVVKVREIMREMQEIFRLRPTVHSLSRQVRAASSSLWEGLVETQSKRLGGYGKVPGQLAEYLDPALERIIECVLSITRVFEKGRTP
jgi:hypothetical protein